MTLENSRKKIDAKDRELLAVIAKRQSYLKEIARFKKKHGLPIHQPKREKEILAGKATLAKKYKLNPVMVKKIFRLIMADSRKIQKNLEI